MAFKELTKEGENFITTVCSGNGNDLISGSNKFRLNFTNQPPNTIYTALAKDHKGKPIETNAQLGDALISWFNEYSKLYNLDANIIAAQTYTENKYSLWNYPNPLDNKSSQGITQVLSSELFNIVIGNAGSASHASTLFTDEEIETLTNGLTDPKLELSYKYTNNAGGESTAQNNRLILFQNCLDNPHLLIKAQCRLMEGISFKAANNAASTLFGYNQGSIYVRPTFTATLKNAESQSGYNDGLQYVDNVFKLLGDVNAKPKGISFGYDIDFSFDEFTADVKSSNIELDNINKSTKLSKNYTLGQLITTSQGQINIPSKLEFDKLKIFANEILEPINTYFGIVLIVNSSFRSDAVNASVGGVVTSQHRLAEAADVRINTTDPDELYRVYEKIIEEKIVPYDQIIYETKGTTIAKRWIHISYNSDSLESNRTENLLATLVGKSMKYSPYIG